LFRYVGQEKSVGQHIPFFPDKKAKLVCSFLKTYYDGRLNTTTLVLVRELEDNASCQALLSRLWESLPKKISETKFSQHTFIRHLHDRCILLRKIYEKDAELKRDRVTGFSSVDTSFFSKVFGHFLSEVTLFANQSLRSDWTTCDQGFLCLGNEGMSMNMLHLSCASEKEAREKTSIVSVPILDRETAISHPERLRVDLAPALDVESSQMVNILQRGTGYVLTPDFALKLYILNERRKAGISTLFSGDTGVGKVLLFLPRFLLL